MSLTSGLAGCLASWSFGTNVPTHAADENIDLLPVSSNFVSRTCPMYPSATPSSIVIGFLRRRLLLYHSADNLTGNQGHCFRWLITEVSWRIITYPVHCYPSTKTCKLVGHSSSIPWDNPVTQTTRPRRGCSTVIRASLNSSIFISFSRSAMAGRLKSSNCKLTNLVGKFHFGSIGRSGA